LKATKEAGLLWGSTLDAAYGLNIRGVKSEVLTLRKRLVVRGRKDEKQRMTVVFECFWVKNDENHCETVILVVFDQKS